MPGQPVTEEQKQKKRERERQKSIPVIAQTWWKKLLHKFFSWALNRFLYIEICDLLFVLLCVTLFA